MALPNGTCCRAISHKRNSEKRSSTGLPRVRVQRGRQRQAPRRVPRRPRAREAANQSGRVRRKGRQDCAVALAVAQNLRPGSRPSNCGSRGPGRRRRVLPRAWETAHSKAPTQAPDRALGLLGRKQVRRTTYFPPQEGRGLGVAARATASRVETGAGDLPQKICEPRTMAPRRSRALQIRTRGRREIGSWPNNQRAGHWKSARCAGLRWTACGRRS